MADTNEHHPQQQAALRRGWWLWPAVALAGVVLVLMRLHAFELPLEADEGNYAYIGGRLLAGDRLYVDVWDHQPPGVFALFAGVIAVFGDGPLVFRWMATGFSLATLALLASFLHRWWGRAAAVSGAALFAVVSSDPATSGEGCNREIYMVSLIVAAWWFAVRPGRPRIGWLVAAGTLLGIASLLKTVVAVHWLFLAIWLAIRLCRNTDSASPSAAAASEGRPRSGRPPSGPQTGTTEPGSPALQPPPAGAEQVAAGHTAAPTAPIARTACGILAFGIGPATLWLATLLYFAAADRASEFIDAVFLVNLGYSGSGGAFGERFLHFFSPPGHLLPVYSALPLWWAGVGAVAVLLVTALRHRHATAWALLALLAASYVVVCLPAQFWPHYYYLMIPALVIAVTAVAGQLAAWAGTLVPSHHARTALSVILYAAVPGLTLHAQWGEYLSRSPLDITLRKYNTRDFWARGIAEKVRSVTDRQDRVFVFSNDASIYYYAGRRCASRFTMVTGLRAAYAGAEQRRALLLDDLTRHRPRLILILSDEDPFDEWVRFLHTRYGDPIGWDFHDLEGHPIMFVLADPARPVRPIDWNWDRSEIRNR